MREEPSSRIRPTPTSSHPERRSLWNKLRHNTNLFPDLLWFSTGTERLLQAARIGDLEQVQILLESSHRINVNALNEGTTALHVACSEGHTEIVTALIHAGADVSVDSASGWTPLHVAACLGQAECVRKLLERGGADASFLTTNSKETPLHLASQNGKVEVVHILLRHDHSNDIVNAKDSDGRTALMLACRQGSVEVVRLLLNHGALWVGVVDKDGHSAKHLAQLQGHEEIVDLLHASLTGIFELVVAAAELRWLLQNEWWHG